MDVGETLGKRYENQSAITSSSFLLSALSLLDKADMSLPRSQNKRLTLEIALSKIGYMTRLTDKKKTNSPIIALPKQKDVYDLPSDSVPAAPSPTISKTRTADKPKLEVKAAPTKTPKSETKEAKASTTPKKTGTSKISTPTISVDLDKLVASIEEENNEKMSINVPFTPEEIYKVFLDKKAETKSNSLKSAIDYCKIIIEGNHVYIKTPTQIFKDLIHQEMEMTEKIRDLFPKKDLIIRFLVDLSAFPGYQTPQKIKHFTTKEKYEVFKHKNPLFEQLVTEFNLKPR